MLYSTDLATARRPFNTALGASLPLSTHERMRVDATDHAVGENLAALVDILTNSGNELLSLATHFQIELGIYRALTNVERHRQRAVCGLRCAALLASRFTAIFANPPVASSDAEQYIVGADESAKPIL
jgi:hypothetical protein